MQISPLVRLLGPLLLVLLFSACEIINPEEDTPSYLKINKIVLDPSRNATETYGSASNNIQDAWVFANGKLIGTFELPATIPILEKDSVKLEILAGIYADGMRTLHFPLGFYKQYSKTVYLEPEKVVSVDPVVKFDPKTVYPLTIYEDFNNFSGQAAIKLNANSPYKLEVNQDSLTGFAYANGKVGVVYGNASSEDIVLESRFFGKLPQNGTAVFLEMDYRSTMDLQVGVAVSLGGATDEVLDLTLFGNRFWNKTYVNLTDELNDQGFKNASFKIIVRAKRTGNPRDYLALDNIRLLHF